MPYTPTLIIPRKICREMVDHMVKSYPEEMCGGLIMEENDWTVLEWQPIPNVSPNPKSEYRMEEGAQVRMYERAMEADLRVGGLVHSHPTTDARISPGDLSMAAMQDTMYVILAMEPREIRAYSIQKRFTAGGVTPQSHHVTIDQWHYGLDYCWSCHKYEEVREDTYRRCFECGHVFATGQDVVDAHNQDLQHHIDQTDDPEFIRDYRANFCTDPKQLDFCPKCFHSF